VKLRTLIDTLRADLARHWALAPQGLGAKVQQMALSQGLWATLVYRAGQAIYDAPPPIVSLPAKLSYKLAAKWIETRTGISLPASARIGKGLYIGHFGEIIIHPQTVIGDNFSVGQGVTIGTRGRGGGEVPVIGHDVYIGVGAKVLGGISIGDGASVGANAVVLCDVPPGGTAVGVPARVLPKKNRKA
jgi:serine O-acetyltransferase